VIFVETSFFVAMLLAKDPHHSEAANLTAAHNGKAGSPPTTSSAKPGPTCIGAPATHRPLPSSTPSPASSNSAPDAEAGLRSRIRATPAVAGI
jgi:hypothetical protein